GTKRTETTGTKRTVIGPAKQLKVAQIEPKCLALTDRNHWHHLIRVIQRFSINKILFNEDYTEKPKNYVLKYFVKSILDTNEFIVVKDERYPNDFKYLVKDLGNNFLIYRIANEISDPDFIYVALYKKQKYFNDILN
ncbi:MAG: hypothetical protein JJE55_03660, partial [Flavobacteriaceae bacterium]|nr:hypothetical protein [Flavobacteriaceae bacterium]